MERLAGFAIVLCGCASPPAAVLWFAEPDDGDVDPCIAQEEDWFAGLQRVWIAAETDSEVLEYRCIGADGVSGWDALEGRLANRGDLLTGLPVGTPFHVYLVAVPTDDEADCGEEGPRSANLGFCAFSVPPEDPVVLDTDRDFNAPLLRYCQGSISKDDCYIVAETERRRREGVR